MRILIIPEALKNLLKPCSIFLGDKNMATSSLYKTFYLNSTKEAKNFVAMLADSVNNPVNIKSSVKTKSISKEKMATIINKKLNENNLEF